MYCSRSADGEHFLRLPLCVVGDFEANKNSRRRVHLAQLLRAVEAPAVVPRPFYSSTSASASAPASGDRSRSPLRGVLSLESAVSAQHIAATSDALLVRSRRLLELYEPLVRSPLAPHSPPFSSTSTSYCYCTSPDDCIVAARGAPRARRFASRLPSSHTSRSTLLYTSTGGSRTR